MKRNLWVLVLVLVLEQTVRIKPPETRTRRFILKRLLFLLRFVGNMISYLKLISILLMISGQNPFTLLGTDTPAVWAWSQNNKIFSCLMAFFICNLMETHFLSTGAFEVTLNGEC
ncbi:Selenoprotein T2 [Ataeniobius toweri]|uniref:Selenoprotein T n=1 Tax=Ataeniobius toweri TaxID=208326 RepID=A0ABU7BS85_9TELE|nr:Selenoprotein T2 [Ataeniobius toweri]